MSSDLKFQLVRKYYFNYYKIVLHRELKKSTKKLLQWIFVKIGGNKNC